MVLPFPLIQRRFIPTGGSDTVSPNIWVLQPPADISQMFSTVQSVFLAMSLYPDVQRRAQAELDAVVGPNRLPDFEDRDTLVYINALIRETLRWQIMLPFAIPHMTVEDDEFRGRFIPAGTNILPNVWYAYTRLFLCPASDF